MPRGIPKWVGDTMRLSTLIQRYAEHAGQRRGYSARTVETYALTHQQYMAYILSHGGLDDLRQFNIETVEGFAEYMAQEGLSPNTIAPRLGHLSVLAKYAMTQRDERRRPLMDTDPVQYVERPQKTRPAKKLLYAQEAMLIAETPAPKNEAILRDVWMDTALRASELCRLNVGDVTRDSEGRAVIATTVKGRGRREERIQIQLGETVTARLKDWLLERGIPGPTEPLLLNQLGERYSRSAVYHAIVRLGQRAGITRTTVNPHAIRHLWNTVARGQGVDTATRAKLLNHADMRTLQAYDHVMPQETSAAREQVRQALRPQIGEAPDTQRQAPTSFADFLKESRTSK